MHVVNTMRLILRSFLQLESFGYYNNNGDLLINNIKENVSELVIITEVKFIKKFLHACVKIDMERS